MCTLARFTVTRSEEQMLRGMLASLVAAFLLTSVAPRWYLAARQVCCYTSHCAHVCFWNGHGTVRLFVLLCWGRLADNAAAAASQQWLKTGVLDVRPPHTCRPAVPPVTYLLPSAPAPCSPL